MRFSINKSLHSQRAFSMLEVVVAMAVGAIGIIAFAGLQLKSAEISDTARQRAAAAYIAEEMAERMSSNAQDYRAQQYYQGTISSYWNSTYNANYFLDYSWCGSPGSCPNDYDRAIYDIIEIKYLASSMLPNGRVGHRMCGTGNTFDCIVVAWQDADVNTCGLTMDGSGLDDCYILQLKIW